MRVGDEVVRVANCDLCVGPKSAGQETWDFEREHAAEIDAAWEVAKRDHPNYFNGRLHLMERHAIRDGTLAASFVRTDFKSFLYWRARGFPEAGVTDTFGSALIRAADGAILLGRQRDGHLNGGLTYLPGGFIDARDVVDDGAIDIEASVLREVGEETGLAVSDLERVPGFVLTPCGRQLSIAIELRSPLSAVDLAARVTAFIAGEEGGELAGVVTVRRLRDLDGLAMPDYARKLLGSLLSGGA